MMYQLGVLVDYNRFNNQLRKFLKKVKLITISLSKCSSPYNRRLLDVNLGPQANETSIIYKRHQFQCLFLFSIGFLICYFP